MSHLQLNKVLVRPFNPQSDYLIIQPFLDNQFSYQHVFITLSWVVLLITAITDHRICQSNLSQALTCDTRVSDT